jgi:hypothetical protein
MRHLLIALLSLSLAGCWMGNGLYADGDARRAIEPGTYQGFAPKQAPGQLQVSLLPNGLTRISDKNGGDDYGFAPLDPGRGTFVAWTNDKEERIGARHVQLYFLATRSSDGSLTLYIPSCDGDEAAIATTAGATVEKSTPAACHFPTRTSVEKALRRLRPVNADMTLKLVPAQVY